MTGKRPWITVLAIPLCLASVLVAGVERAHSAYAGSPEVVPFSAGTCTSTSPCLQETNNGKGAGVAGISLLGKGIVGETKFKSTSLSNNSAGVFGSDLSTTGVDDNGVFGLSVRGRGVLGQSTSGYGAWGISTSNFGLVGSGAGGLAAIGNSIGGVVQGRTLGLEASETLSSTSSDSILALGNGGRLFRGNNHVGADVFVVDDSGNLMLTGFSQIGGALRVDSGNAVNFGTTSSGTLIGLYGDNGPGTGSGGGAGVEGVGNTTSTAVFASGFGGLLYGSNNSVGRDVFHVDDAGNAHAHTFTADLAVASGEKVVTYSAQASQPIVEDFGEAQLTNGSGYVRFDTRFASTMAQGLSYLVFITPEGDNRGLYVTQKSAQGFAVHESQGGRSSLVFSYRIVAKPLGIQAPRLPLLFQHRTPKYMPGPRTLYVPARQPTTDKKMFLQIPRQ